MVNNFHVTPSPGNISLVATTSGKYIKPDSQRKPRFVLIYPFIGRISEVIVYSGGYSQLDIVPLPQYRKGKGSNGTARIRRIK
jgi:hypothetical protein